MSLHLITGYAGQEHITSADQGAYNMGTFGEGEFVLDRGSKFAATVVSNNSITIANGEALMQGRFIKLPVGTTESVSIDNGASGMKRKDLIVLRYSKDSGTGIESVALAVKKGTPSSSTPADPSVTTGNITDGTDLVNEMKLYRVNIDGLNITSLDTLFSLKTTMVDYMDNYQMPIANTNVLGGIKKGVNVSIQSDGTLSVAEGGKYVKGVLQVGDRIDVTEGVLSNPLASKSAFGVMKVGNNLSVSDGVVDVPVAASGVLGVAKPGNGLTMDNGALIVKDTTYSSDPNGVHINDSTASISIPANSYVEATVKTIATTHKYDKVISVGVKSNVAGVVFIPYYHDKTSDKIRVYGAFINLKTSAQSVSPSNLTLYYDKL